MNREILVSLVYNTALLLALGLLYDSVTLRRSANRHLRELFVGLVIGGIGIVVMANPWVLAPGLVFDTRSILLALTGLFFGTVPTMVAAALAVAFRLFQGGIGAPMGVTVIVVTSAIGLLWKSRRAARGLEDHTVKELYLFGLAVHAAMLLCTLVLPAEIILSTLRKIILPVLLVYPAGTVLLGRLLARNLERRQREERLKELSRSNAVLGGIGEVIVRARDQEALFRETCSLVAEQGDFPLAWIGRVGRDGREVLVAAKAGAQEEYAEGLGVSLDPGDPASKGPIGRAVASGYPVICNDPASLAEGFRSLGVFPLAVSGRCMGTLNLYSGKAGFFDGPQVDLYTKLARNLSFALEFFETEKQRHLAVGEIVLHRDRLEMAQAVGHVGSWEFNLETGRIWGSKEGLRFFGITPPDSGEVSVERIEACIPDRARVHQCLVDLAETGEPYDLQYEVVPEGGGEKRVVSSRADLVRDGEGKPLKIVGVVRDITEQKKFERMIGESEALMRGLFDTMTSGAAIYEVKNSGESGKDYVVREFNRKALEIEGKTKEQVVGKSLLELRPNIDEYGLIGVFRKVLETGEPQFFPASVYVDEQYCNWYENRVFRLPGGEIVALFDDVTERVRAEETLKISEARYRALLEALPDILFVTDRNGVFLDYHATERTELFLPPGEFMGKNIQDLFSGDVARQYEAAADRVVEKGEMGVFDYSLPYPDGNRHFEARIVEFPEDRFLTVIRDLTDRYRAEAALKQSERRLEFALTASSDGIWDWDIKSGEVFYSPQYYRMLGFAPGEFEANFETWRGLVHPEDLVKAEAAIVQSLTLDEGYEVEQRMRMRQGNWKWVLARGRVMERDADGQALRMVGTQVDIDGRKQAEKEIRLLNADLERRVGERTFDLEAANRELESFSYSVSHDLRAPLRAIAGFSVILEEEHAGQLGEEGVRLLGIIRGNTGKMGALIDDLLAFSRLGRAEVRKGVVSMNVLVESVVRDLCPEGTGNVRLAVEELPGAYGDRALLQQLWSNLLGNAFKFSSKVPEPAVTVGGYARGPERVYYVRDNGVGFDMRFAAKLFKVFQRLHAESEFPGTGVGLAIVDRIVKRHGGQAWAEGKPGQGATFYFSLPES